MTIYNRPLAILPSVAPAFARQFEVIPPEPDASRFVGARAGAPYRTTESGVAVIPVTAPLVNRMSAWPGLLSYEWLGAVLSSAAADPKVTAIAIDCDSPGGEVHGCFELAAQIRAIDKTKPVVAHVNGYCASACYALASACRSITATESSTVGSVGIVMLHLDVSRALDREGISPTLLHAPEGGHKVDAHPFAPLPDAVKADLQGELNKFLGMFLDAVAAGRGARLSASAAKATEAKVYVGAEAKAVGLVDAIGSFSDVLADVERSARVAAASRRLAAEAPKPAEPVDPWAEVIGKLNAEPRKAGGSIVHSKFR